MKIVLINTTERTGGAAVAANRLMKALNKSGEEVKMLVRDKCSNDPDVFTVDQSYLTNRLNYFRFVWERLVIFFQNKFDKKQVFRVSIANSGTDISKHPLIREADIIHLHWINQGFLSLNGLQKILALGKPVVWTMHDMWACTGICHYAQTCTNFQEQCGNCFYLNSTKKNDLSNRIFEEKRIVYAGGLIYFACCSNWIKEILQLSPLTKNLPKRSVPNPIDITVYKQTNKNEARKQFGLPPEKLLILFGAVNINDKRKGISFLIEGLYYLNQNYPEIHEQIELVVFGQVKSDISYFNLPVHSMGYLQDERKIAELYNAVDIFVTTSLEDNLPNTIMEAMACGIPCVGFNTGGIPEMIDHKVTGYISEHKSIEDLAEGICWCLDKENHESLSQNSRKKVLNHYAEAVVARQYIDIYKHLLKNSTHV